MAGAAGKPLSQKLGLKPGFCIFMDGAPADYCTLAGEWPEGAKLVREARAPLDVGHLFATEAKGLAARLRKYRAMVTPDGMIWVSWPKKTSGIATDLSDIVVRDTALPLGLVDIKVCAVDDVWSGLKFVIPKGPRNTRSSSSPGLAEPGPGSGFLFRRIWRERDIRCDSCRIYGGTEACPSDGARSSPLSAVQQWFCRWLPTHSHPARCARSAYSCRVPKTIRKGSPTPLCCGRAWKSTDGYSIAIFASKSAGV